MPRGVRRADYTSELKEIDEKIRRYKESIAALESRRKEVLTLQKKNEAEKLFSFMDANGLSADDIIAKLSVESVSA